MAHLTIPKKTKTNMRPSSTRHSFTSAFTLFTMGLTLLFGPACATAREKLNVISIVTDDQAPWTLSCYGGEESKTPSLDRIAAEGARFINAFVATPVCSPSRATFLTGRYGTQLGVTDFLSQEEDDQGFGLRPGTVTWPAVLHRNGYATMLAGKWHLGRAPASRPEQFGFDRFYGFLGAGTLSMTPTFDFPDGQRKLNGCTADLITDEALAFIESKRAQPFALCLHFREPHEPYGPMPETDTRALAALDPTLPDAPGLDAAQIKKWRRAYYTAVHAIDRNVGRVIAALEKHGLWDKTVILFTSDNGYNIGEHTIHGKGNATWIAGGLEGPRRPNLWDSSLRVPLLVRWPGVGRPGAVIEDVVSNVDTFASVFGMLGIESPRDWKTEGVDFSPRLRGQAQPPRDTLFEQYDLHNLDFARMRAARTAQWKLVRHFEGRLADEFYDLSSDPDERHNLTHWGSLAGLTPAQKQTHADLDAKLRAWMQSINDPLLKQP